LDPSWAEILENHFAFRALLGIQNPENPENWSKTGKTVETQTPFGISEILPWSEFLSTPLVENRDFK